VREVIAKYVELPPLELPEPIARKSYGAVEMKQQAKLFESLHVLSSPARRACPEPMELMGQNNGFIVYSTDITGPRAESQLNIQEIRDRAMVFVNGEYQGVIERWNSAAEVKFAVPREGVRLTLLVENMGRINYGQYLKDPKGITEGVRFGQQFLYDWTIHTLPLEDLTGLDYKTLVSAAANEPAFYLGKFEVDELADTFLNVAGWTKGVAYINGFNLGRYWSAGPQGTLYIPGPLLKRGANELVLFELHGCNSPSVVLQDSPILDIGNGK
jgi:beta-galactosidase